MSCFSKFYVVLIALFAASSIYSEVVYKVDGKEVRASDLPPAIQQQMFEAQADSWERVRQAIENSLFEEYLEAQAKKLHKSKEAVLAELTKISEIKEKELKEWFEKNKSRIPYPFDQIKGEIKKHLEGEKREEKRREIVQRVKSDRKYSFELKRPEPPVLQVNIEGFPTKGGASAKVTLVEFADYQCPHCKETAPVLKQIADRYKDKVKIVYVDYPINPSGISRVIAQGGYCAMKQGKFWEYNLAAFNLQPQVTRETPLKVAKDLKLNEQAFKDCIDSQEAVSHVERGKKEGERIGVSGTPFILINGKRHMAGHSFEDFKKSIDQIL